MYMCVCVCAYVRVCVRVCVFACVTQINIYKKYSYLTGGKKIIDK